MRIISKKLDVVLFVVITLSFLVLWSSPFPRSSTSKIIIDPQNKITSTSDIVLRNGVPKSALFTNDSSSHTYQLQ
ncbi:MAG: hypothetical protein ACW991_07350, partial [Candidatus Hodarchaeales archaeon]